MKFLIAGFDGLRPDFATPDNMPRLAGFLEKSHTWENYLACFPTETYVNHPSIFSGVRPERHGVIANSFCYEDEKRRMHLFAGFRIDSVMEADALMHGLYAVPDLGARLAREGKRLRIYCANSPGSTRLQHVHASDCKGHLNAPVHALDQTIPAREAHELIRTHGKGVPLEFPDALGTTLTVDLFFERELKDGPEGLAEATVLWIGEPDHSEHELGLFSDRTLEGLRQADREFGRVLDWWETQGRAKDIQLVVMSDHGHVEVARHADFEEILENAGLHVLTGSDIARGAEPRADDVILIGEYTSGIWVPGKKRET
ncbi:MAG: alkaline phosphatase family protein, partial [Sutterella wadsworthensis]|nr:alkaline phosphatase family protein [Sutterella wadsworthensis]